MTVYTGTIVERWEALAYASGLPDAERSCQTDDEEVARKWLEDFQQKHPGIPCRLSHHWYYQE